MSILSRRLSSFSHAEAGSQPLAGAIGVYLQERRLAALFQIHAADQHTTDAIRAELQLRANPKPGFGIASETHTLMGNGPGDWLLAANTEPAATLRTRVEAVVAADVSLTDLSHARSVLRISGVHGVDLLAKGIPIDIETMIEGNSTSTLFAHFNIHLYCCSQGCFDLFVYRSFGLALFEALQYAAREYGFEATLAS